MTPKPRREGQRGGMNHTGSQARSARRGGDPGRYGGGPPKKSCLLLLFILLAIPLTVLTATGGLILVA